MHLLYTGFEPFGEHDYNPAWDVARAASEQLRGEGTSEAVRLPVEFEAVRNWAFEEVSKFAGEAVPDAIVQFGLGESRTTIDLESTARNVRGCRVDEEGARRDEPGRLCSGAPDRLDSTAPVGAIRARLASRIDSPAIPDPSVSEDAGDYVCNALYYHTLRRIRSTDAGADVLFVHVPRLEPGGAQRVGAIFGDVFREHGRL